MRIALKRAEARRHAAQRLQSARDQQSLDDVNFRSILRLNRRRLRARTNPLSQCQINADEIHRRTCFSSRAWHQSNSPNQSSRIGGARRDRTDDLMLAKHALSQLSYGPFRPQTAAALVSECAGRRAGKRSFMRWRWLARTDLNCRPHAYQARALTS